MENVGIKVGDKVRVDLIEGTWTVVNIWREGVSQRIPSVDLKAADQATEHADELTVELTECKKI